MSLSTIFISSGFNNELLKFWNTPKITTLEGHTQVVFSVTVSGKYIISGSLDNTIKIWDLSTSKLVTTLEGHNGYVMSVAVSGIINTAKFPDNIGKQYIISGSEDKTIKIWDFSTFKLIKSLESHTNSVKSVAVSDKYIISGSEDNTIKIWEKN